MNGLDAVPLVAAQRGFRPSVVTGAALDDRLGAKLPKHPLLMVCEPATNINVAQVMSSHQCGRQRPGHSPLLCAVDAAHPFGEAEVARPLDRIGKPGGENEQVA
ncbi:hypothetical protein RHAB21_03844 [Pseudorhizobium halotolerans]|uniref:Uncharacterized protein n=1 Tax=Pseudorhizobium halotolerans TaxID=1233081 RepID=A0ABM8PTN2_9HYPH|nr:hypothetical protein RHAB21_03844 [Pseudorhizobium halotolerans]